MSVPHFISFRVMTKDIRGAKREEYDCCPIARALKRQLQRNDVRVFDSHIEVGWERFPHTEDTKSFMELWDDGYPSHATDLYIERP